AEEAGLGKYLMQRLIDSLKQAIPNGLEEIQTLARTLISSSQDVLAYFAHPRTSNGPTEAINGRLEHLRGIALGFRNLTSYTIRSLIHTGRLKDHLTTTT
uniref:transposase n=1 Tax=Actinomyces oris TaxID=544580 RepID=UPI0026F0661C